MSLLGRANKKMIAIVSGWCPLNQKASTNGNMKLAAVRRYKAHVKLLSVVTADGFSIGLGEKY